MTDKSWNELKARRADGMSDAERAVFESAYADEAQLAAEVDEQIQAAREATEADVRASLATLDGGRKSAIRLLSGMSDEQIEGLGGIGS
jgi:hypothetical protein